MHIWQRWSSEVDIDQSVDLHREMIATHRVRVFMRANLRAKRTLWVAVMEISKDLTVDGMGQAETIA